MFPFDDVIMIVKRVIVSWKARACLSYKVYTIAADDLVTQGFTASLVVVSN